MSKLKDNMWHQRFGDKEYYYGKAPNDFLKEAAKHIPESSTVVSLGEGEGAMPYSLLSKAIRSLQ